MCVCDNASEQPLVFAEGAEADFSHVDAPNAAEPQEADDPPKADVTGSLESPGLLHTRHNAGAGLGSCMEGYAENVGKLKKVARTTAHKESKDRLLSTCFGDPGVPEEFKRQIKHFRQVPYEQRWGNVAASVKLF